MSRRPTAIVLLFACCFLAPSTAQARGIGTDYFLLSPDGKLLWQHQWERTGHVDLQAELSYRIRDDQLTATPFGKRDPLWRCLTDMPVALFNEEDAKGSAWDHPLLGRFKYDDDEGSWMGTVDVPALRRSHTTGLPTHTTKAPDPALQVSMC